MIDSEEVQVLFTADAYNPDGETVSLAAAFTAK
jgi:hypothetical protein